MYFSCFKVQPRQWKIWIWKEKENKNKSWEYFTSHLQWTPAWRGIRLRRKNVMLPSETDPSPFFSPSKLSVPPPPPNWGVLFFFFFWKIKWQNIYILYFWVLFLKNDLKRIITFHSNNPTFQNLATQQFSYFGLSIKT